MPALFQASSMKGAFVWCLFLEQLCSDLRRQIKRLFLLNFFFRMISDPQAIPTNRSNQQTPFGSGPRRHQVVREIWWPEGFAMMNNVVCCLIFISAFARGCLSQPHRHMLEAKRPTPVLILFKVTQRLRGRLEPGERQIWEGGVMSFRVFIHALLISNPEAIWVAPWRWKGCFDFRRCGWRLCRSGIESYRGCLLLNAASHPSLYVSCSLRRFDGAMPARIGNSPVGVGRKHPVIRRSVSFSATSSFLL